MYQTGAVTGSVRFDTSVSLDAVKSHLMTLSRDPRYEKVSFTIRESRRKHSAGTVRELGFTAADARNSTPPHDFVDGLLNGLRLIAAGSYLEFESADCMLLW